jgi:hypothetical protein
MPLAARLALFAAVVVVALLPFVLTGKVAEWAALAFVGLTVVAVVVGMIWELLYIGRTAERGDDPASGGGSVGRRHVAIALATAVLAVPLVIALRGGSDNSPSPTPPTQEQIDRLIKKLTDCNRTHPAAGECVRRIVHSRDKKGAD